VINPEEYLFLKVEPHTKGLNLQGVPVLRRYKCECCHTFHDTIDIAKLCCDPACIECGEKVESRGRVMGVHHVRCAACSDKLHAKRMAEIRADNLRKSKIIGAPTHRFVYHPDFPNDGYLCLDDYPPNMWTLPEIIADLCANMLKPIPVPCYVFDCDSEVWEGMSIDEVLSNELSEWFDDAEDHLTGMDELRQAVKEFNAKQNLEQFHRADRVIPLDTDAFNELVEKLAQGRGE
jgi:hypothetical protein